MMRCYSDLSSACIPADLFGGRNRTPSRGARNDVALVGTARRAVLAKGRLRKAGAYPLSNGSLKDAHGAASLPQPACARLRFSAKPSPIKADQGKSRRIKPDQGTHFSATGRRALLNPTPLRFRFTLDSSGARGQPKAVPTGDDSGGGQHFRPVPARSDSVKVPSPNGLRPRRNPTQSRPIKASQGWSSLVKAPIFQPKPLRQPRPLSSRP